MEDRKAMDSSEAMDGSEAPFDLRAWARLKEQLRDLPGAVVAFSGGVDSTVLLAACAEILGKVRVRAVIADSASLARSELAEARRLAASLGVELTELRTGELGDPRYRANAGDRCFWCKEALFEGATPLAAALGWPLLYGENLDDGSDHRPGARSAAQRGVRAPLRDAGWTKQIVRAYARSRGLPVADKPSNPCLASRLPVGVPVSRAALARVEEVEAALRRRGYRILRARHLDDRRLRLEFGEADLERALGEAGHLAELGRSAGYATVEVDPRGYRSGSVAR